MNEVAPSYPGADTSFVTFGDGVRAFLAIPKASPGPFPAAILYHERYGLVEHTLDLAAKFALYGHVALAPDLFSRWEGDKAALNRGEISVSLPQDEIRAYSCEALDYLLAHPLVRPSRIAAVGVCQSGSYPFLLNSLRREVAANVVAYGGAHQAVWEASERNGEPYESILERITAPVLGIWGEDDHVTSVEDVLHLRGVLEQKRKSYEFVLFRDMPHGWFNSTMPGRYRPRETDQAWNIIMDFLERVYAGSFPRDRVIWRFESNTAVDYDFTKKIRLA